MKCCNLEKLSKTQKHTFFQSGMKYPPDIIISQNLIQKLLYFISFETITEMYSNDEFI